MDDTTPTSFADPTPSAAEQYLGQRDPVMADLIRIWGPCRLNRRNETPFQTLARSIIGQQISAKAAASIRQRVVQSLPAFTPQGLLASAPDPLRAAGLSAAKIRYLLELARVVDSGRLDFDALRAQPDETVIATLTALPGIGRWTAEMFLIFAFQRPDVLALGNAGLKRAVKQLYGDTATLAATARIWRPHASTASWYLWRSLDAAPASSRKPPAAASP